MARQLSTYLFQTKSTLSALVMPPVVALGFWSIALVLYDLGFAYGISPLYYSLMVFESSAILLISMTSPRFALAPIFQLFIVAGLLYGSFFRVLMIWFNGIAIMSIIMLYLNNPSKSKDKEEVSSRNRRLFFIVYLFVGMTLFPAAMATFSFRYSNPLTWLLIALYGVSGWFYPRPKRFVLAITFLYWFGTILFAGLVIIPNFSLGLAQMAISANLTGMYLTLLRFSRLRYHGN